jgi:hypothetical protein
MEAHNAHTNLVQHKFHTDDYVVLTVAKKRQQKISLLWKCPYLVNRVFYNTTLSIRGLFREVIFITHVIRKHFDRDLKLLSGPRGHGGRISLHQIFPLCPLSFWPPRSWKKRRMISWSGRNGWLDKYEEATESLVEK